MRPLVARVLGAAAVIFGLTSALAFTAAAPAGTPVAHYFDGRPTVGALFSAGGAHYCTASVVASRRGDVLITAAHCVTGTGVGLVFVPGYHDGRAPYGRWRVTAVYASPGWISSQRGQRDVAFLTVARTWWHGRLREVQDVTGGNRLVTALPRRATVTVSAYDDADGSDPDRPVTCTTRVTWDGSWPRFDCDRFVDGSSGAPWLRFTPAGTEVVGVIGGLHQGGCRSWTSYSADFGPATLRLFARAAAGLPGDRLPAPGGDGCSTGL